MDGNGGGGGVLPFYHVPQQSRREKLRYPTYELLDHLSPPPHLLQHHHNPPAVFVPPPSESPGYGGGGAAAAGSHLHPLFAHQGVSLSLASYIPSPCTDDPIRISAASPLLSEPFTAVLTASRFLKPAQQMLGEICNVLARFDHPPAPSELGLDAPGAGGVQTGGSSGDRGPVNATLICMMDEVCRRYKQYHQQVQYVVTSFESVVGLGNAAAPFALRFMTKHFRSLKSAIAEQLRFTERIHGKESQWRDEEMHGFGRVVAAGGHRRHEVVTHSSGGHGQPLVWRPQRGLPERAVAVLKAWLFEHFLHPYPTDTDKHMLAKQTGLSRNQVSNWFINARVRLWKPLVEEIHSLEMRQQASKAPDVVGHRQRMVLPPATASCEPNTGYHPSQDNGLEKNHGPPQKRFCNEYHHPQSSDLHIEEPVGMLVRDLQAYGLRLGGDGLGVLTTGNTGGVSLTLG